MQEEELLLTPYRKDMWQQYLDYRIALDYDSSGLKMFQWVFSIDNAMLKAWIMKQRASRYTLNKTQIWYLYKIVFGNFRLSDYY